MAYLILLVVFAMIALYAFVDIKQETEAKSNARKAQYLVFCILFSAAFVLWILYVTDITVPGPMAGVVYLFHDILKWHY